jgi:hypothetical protein
MTDPTSELDDLRRHIAYKRDSERSLDPRDAAHMLAALDDGAAPNYQTLLRAASWPTPPTFVFHTAPQQARETITTDGLRISQPGDLSTDSPWADPDDVWSSQDVGVYVTDRPDTTGKWSRWESWDVWRIEITGLPYTNDPMNPHCWVIGADISPDRLTLDGSYPKPRPTLPA